MKSQWVNSFVTGLVLTFVAMPLWAQQQESNPGIVAILDVAKVFKDNADFDTQMKAIKAEADQLKTEINSKQESIRTDAAKLNEYEVGSADRNQLEANLEQRQTSLRTYARQAEQELLNREAKIYFDKYRQMQTVVESLAKQYGISLVLRFDSSAIDPNNRPEVIKGVNRSVVYHSHLDLTKMVIDGMTTSTANAGANQNK